MLIVHYLDTEKSIRSDPIPRDFNRLFSSMKPDCFRDDKNAHEMLGAHDVHLIAITP